jgi:hypothetical protein
VAFRSPDPESDLVKLAQDWGATEAIVTSDDDVAALEHAGVKVHRIDAAAIPQAAPA